MEYVYAALLLHKVGKPVDVDGITKVIQASGANADESKIKSLVTSLKDVDIDAELSSAVIASAAAPASAEGGASEEPKAEEKKEEPKEAAAAGLSALFG